MRTRFAYLVVLLFAGSLTGWAQRPPAPAASSGPISAVGADQKGAAEISVETEQPQDISSMPASSVKLPSLTGGPQLLTYGLRVMEIASKNPVVVGRGNGVQSVTMLSGTTSLNRNWGRSSLDFSYNGAESLYAGGGVDSQLASTHQFSFNTSLARSRWTLSLSNALSYAPQSSFGLGLYGGLGSNPLGFASDLRSGFYSNDTILSSGNRIDNSTVAELGYQLSPRSSLRVNGGFGLLHFRNSGFSNSWQTNFGFGLDHVLSRRSNVSLTYNLFRTKSEGFSTVQAHSVLLGYTRQLTPRLGVQISAGPQVQVESNTGTSNSVGWTTSNTLLYQMHHSTLTLMYSAGLNGGSGVYGASRNQTVQASLSRPVARFWSAVFDMGYAQNSGVGVRSRLRAEQAGITLGRRVQGMGLSFSYQFQHQSIGNSCIGLSCAAFNGWSHTFGVGLDWIFRPIRIG